LVEKSNQDEIFYSSAVPGIDGSSVAPLTITPDALSLRARGYYDKVKSFIETKVEPREQEFMKWSTDPHKQWTVNPALEQLKVL